MRTTLNIDDDLLAEAQRVSLLTEKVALVREGLRALIERESARRLAKLGGTFPLIRTLRNVRSPFGAKHECVCQTLLYGQAPKVRARF